MPRKVVLAYSGGLDTSIIIPWLKETYGCDVIAMIGDVGQKEDLEAARRKALATGASSASIEDLREEFITGYIWPTLRAGAVYEHKYLLGTSFARPVIAKRQAEIALRVGADAVAHGCTGKGNDQVRFELAYKAIAPDVKILAPWREWKIDSREDAIAYARAHNVSVEQTKANIYSRDRNIWHLSHEGGALEDPVNAPEDAMWQWIVSPERAPDAAAEVAIGFDSGTPVSVNDKHLGPVALLEELNALAAANGVGRIDLVENRLVGMKSRGAYETPGGTLLVLAHRELEALCLDRETAHYSQLLSLRYAEIVYYGLWFTALREALDSFFSTAQQRVTGTVGLRLYKGNVSVTRRESPYSLYRSDLASFSMTHYNPKDAEGFINLFALPVTPPAPRTCVVNEPAQSAAATKLWGGRFDGPPNELFYEFQRSLPFDRRLLPYELAVDRAWARAIHQAGILTLPEMTQTLAALDDIAKRAAAAPSWLDASPAEDVHHFVELALVELLGPLGFKLHTARSRNELVAADFRLFVKDAARESERVVAGMIDALAGFAERAIDVPMPGMTHLQHAQPLLFSHFLLAHAEAFFRDLDRIAAAGRMADSCPLGSGALSGCAFPVDRIAIARELGFARISANSLDAVGDRDFALDYLYALATLAMHLSHLAEDFVLFASQEFSFVALPDEYSTGSSLMPQKKNPDAWELLRGKTGRITGALISLLVTLKGLPSSYQRDLQEDKEPVFAAHDQMTAMIRVATGAIASMQFNEAKLREAAADTSLLATEVAHYLVRRGLPFRQAHEVVGRIVRDAERGGDSWAAMPLAKLKTFSPLFDSDLHAALTLAAALESRDVPGGTAPARVRAALTECRSRLAVWESRL